MPPFTSVLCTVDFSDLSKRVMYHAAGLAGAAGARLTLLHVADDRARTADREIELQRAFLETVPYGATYVPEPQVQIETGDAVDAILRVAGDRAADLIVCGTRARGGLARLFLGSTSAALLERTDRPTLLVPPANIDLVTLGLDRADLHLGAVLAAVDLADHTRAHLTVASALAALARQHLLLMTVVADDGLDDHSAARALRERAHGLEPAPPHALIVRRGDVAKEIARCAVTEKSGLVVMGLRKEGRPGTIAIEVLQTGRAYVLAVPTS